MTTLASSVSEVSSLLMTLELSFTIIIGLKYRPQVSGTLVLFFTNITTGHNGPNTYISGRFTPFNELVYQVGVEPLTLQVFTIGLYHPLDGVTNPNVFKKQTNRQVIKYSVNVGLFKRTRHSASSPRNIRQTL